MKMSGPRVFVLTSRLERVFSLGLVLCLTLSLMSCKSSLSTKEGGLPHLTHTADRDKVQSDASLSGNEPTAASNMAQEKAVAPGILKAWRVATLEKDEARAMKILTDLDKQYPNISTVQFMMGQVRELFGNDKDAVAHYQKAVVINEFSSMQTYKLAESLRKSGDAEGSLVYYRKLMENLEKGVDIVEKEIDERKISRADGNERIEMQKQLLISVRLGLAKALVAAGGHEPEALKVLSKLKKISPSVTAELVSTLKKLIEKSPDNQDAKSFLKDLSYN